MACSNWLAMRSSPSSPPSRAVNIIPTGKPLSLTLRHPVRSDLDQTFQLQPQAGNWRAPAPGLRFDHDWTLLLVPADGAWRLQGRLMKGQLSARVQPVTSG